jgi:hypothetical protein
VRQSGLTLWFFEVGSLALVAVGIFMLIAEHGNRLIALALIVVFGSGAVFFAGMLVLRRPRGERPDLA